MHKIETQLDSSLDELARAAVPLAAGSPNVRRQFETRLKALHANGASGSGTLLTAMSAFVTARSAAPGVELQGFNFQNGSLEVRLKAPDASSIERLRQQLRSAGWQAVLQGGASHGNSFEGRLALKPLGG